MADKIQAILLKFEWMKALGERMEGEKGLLSPFLAMGDVESRIDIEEWKKLGLIGEKDFAPGWRAAFQILAKPAACTRLRLSVGDVSWEYTVYFRPDKGLQVGLNNTQEGFILHYPAAVDEAAEFIGRHTGNSPLQVEEFMAELVGPEAIILCAMLDDYRRALMRALGEDNAFQITPVSAVEVASVINNSSSNWQWLINIISTEEGSAVSEKQVEIILDELVRKGMANRDGDGWVLSEALQKTAQRLLVIDQVVSLEMASVDEAGELNRMAMLCLQSGVNDMLSIEIVDDQVSMEMIPSGQLIKYIEFFTSGESQWFEGLKQEKAPDEKVCPNCGRENLPGSKFCSECGTRLG